jgi:hypothetical protein
LLGTKGYVVVVVVVVAQYSQSIPPAHANGHEQHQNLAVSGQYTFTCIDAFISTFFFWIKGSLTILHWKQSVHDNIEEAGNCRKFQPYHTKTD